MGESAKKRSTTDICALVLNNSLSIQWQPLSFLYLSFTFIVERRIQWETYCNFFSLFFFLHTVHYVRISHESHRLSSSLVRFRCVCVCILSEVSSHRFLFGLSAGLCLMKNDKSRRTLYWCLAVFDHVVRLSTFWPLFADWKRQLPSNRTIVDEKQQKKFQTLFHNVGMTFHKRPKTHLVFSSRQTLSIFAAVLLKFIK